MKLLTCALIALSLQNSSLSFEVDVMAKMPDGATTQQVPEMLQALLAERFKMAAHYEKREVPAYALIVGRAGVTLKEAASDLNMPEGEESREIKGKERRVRHEFDSVSMKRFAALLSRYTDWPIVDQTGLEGRYQASYEIDFTALAHDGLMRITPQPDADSSRQVEHGR